MSKRVLSSLSEEDITLADDLLIGAEAIAKELNWKTSEGKWNTRRVYNVAEKGQVPVHNVKGLGVCARLSALKAYFDALDAPYIERLNDSKTGKE